MDPGLCNFADVLHSPKSYIIHERKDENPKSKIWPVSRCCLITTNSASVMFLPRGWRKTRSMRKTKTWKQIKTGAVVLMRESAFSLETDKTADQSCAGEAALRANHLQPAPHPVSGAWWEGQGGRRRRAAAPSLRVWVGVVQSRQRHCSSLQHRPSNSPYYSECSPGPSPLKQERPGCSPAWLNTRPLCRLRQQLLWSHAWVLGRGEWQGGVCDGGVYTEPECVCDLII